jgi:nicotinate-nucleotide adenylyltransferase
MRDKMRIGIYGGSFDPIHIGHLLVAETCRETLGLDRVIFVPANVSPFKTESHPSSGKQRIEMLELSILSNVAFEIDSREIDRGGVSFTVDTLRAIHAERPKDELLLLMGADSLLEFDRWREPAAICELALPVVVSRAGQGDPPWHVLAPFISETRFEQSKRHVVDMPLIEISSSDLRRRTSQGKSIRYQVPAAVEAYIRMHRLYAP